MSTLSEKRKKLSEIPMDQVYVIYGEPGSGKTVLASSFPKEKDEKMLYLDVVEGGTGSIPLEYEDLIDVVQIENFEQFDEVVTDLWNGYTMVEKKEADGTITKKKARLPKYKTIVIDTITSVEFVLKDKLRTDFEKDSMTLNLWGKAKDNQEGMYNLLKKLHQRTGAHMVSLAHVRKIEDENNSNYDILMPNIMVSASRFLCAKASHVWYTKLEHERQVDPKTNEVEEVDVYTTTIDGDPFLTTKCRKDPKFTGKIPKRIQNLNYDKFKKEVLDIIRPAKEVK